MNQHSDTGHHRSRISAQHRIPAPRGVLSLLVLPTNNRLAESARALGRHESTTHRLHFFDHEPESPRLSKIFKRKRKNKDHSKQDDLLDEEVGFLESSHSKSEALNIFGSGSMYSNRTTNQHVSSYHPSRGEFTLLYFCELNCRNSTRFTKILADFMQAIQKDDHYDDGDAHTLTSASRPIQLICVLNDEIKDLSDIEFRNKLRNGGANIITHLMSQTSFWCLGYDHINRLATIR